MVQEELFELDDDKPWYEDGIVCNNCGITQPITQFQQMQSGEIKRKCRTCARNQSNLIKKLRQIHPYPDKNYSCPICERTIKEISKRGQKKLQNWVLDHCHDTETFRGWLCHHCNTGLGAFSDSLDRIKKAVIYLNKHKEKMDETDT